MDRDVEAGRGWVKSDGQAFFPAPLGHLLTTLNGYPVARWNFVVLDPPPAGGAVATATGTPEHASDLHFLTQLCTSLQHEMPTSFQFQCLLTGSGQQQMAREWARDLALREPMPPESELQSRLNLTLVKAGMPIESALRQVLRTDPTGAYETLLARLEAQKPIKLVVREDFLAEPASGRVLLPMLLDTDPMATSATEKVEAIVNRECAASGNCARVGFLGGHFAALENKRQVMEDLSTVSGAGALSLIALIAAMLLLKKARLLWVVLPVGIGVAVATAMMIWYFGNVHGLTLSFGSGIVGLSVDYGIYTAFHPHTRGVWRSNLMGLLTTLVVLAVLAFSAIPILRQLMVFAILGLSCAFLMIYLMYQLIPTRLGVTPMRGGSWRYRAPLALVAAALSVAGVFGLMSQEVDLNIQRMNFMRPKTAQLYQWFGQQVKLNAMFLLHAQPDDASGPLAALHAEKTWADAAHIRLENAAFYLPPLPEQTHNRATWFAADCSYAFAAGLDATQRRFFAPFFTQRPCDTTAVQDLTGGEAPAYIKHLHGKDNGWVSLFFPQTAAEKLAVKRQYPQAFSLLEVAARFPEIFRAELAWMTPVTLGLVALLLLVYYRSWLYALVALLPFFTGVGAVVAVTVLRRDTFNFVTLIALLMLCGFSTDWGIFAVDGCLDKARQPTQTQSALMFCCLSSTLGVLPMIAAQHPVLRSIGMPLGIGLLGALLGSLTVVPACLDWLAQRGYGSKQLLRMAPSPGGTSDV